MSPQSISMSLGSIRESGNQVIQTMSWKIVENSWVRSGIFHIKGSVWKSCRMNWAEPGKCKFARESKGCPASYSGCHKFPMWINNSGEDAQHRAMESSRVGGHGRLPSAAALFYRNHLLTTLSSSARLLESWMGLSCVHVVSFYLQTKSWPWKPFIGDRHTP